MAIPIFFVHKSDSSYLKYALKQARKFNPDSPIYLVGDESNNQYPFVTHVNSSDYSVSAEEFKKVYRHMSATNIDYELFCFLRWFYIRDFVVQNNIESFICLDSDVLVFSDLTLALKPFQHLSIGIERESMPPFTYFGNRKAIVDFCDFTTRQYVEPNCIKRLEEGWEYHKPRNWGGICDMVIFEFYFNENPESTGRLDVIVNDTVFDYHIRGKNGFEMQGENKKIKWKNGIPFGFYLETKKWICFHGIHYGGGAKALMYKHYSGGGYYQQRLSEYFQELRDKYPLRTMLRKLIKQ